MTSQATVRVRCQIPWLKDRGLRYPGEVRIVPGLTTVADLLGQLGVPESERPFVVAVVDGRPARLLTVLAGGEEVVLMGAISGG